MVLFTVPEATTLPSSWRSGSTTFLFGSVVDQAALHGVMIRIRDLGLPLLSVSRADRMTVDRPFGQSDFSNSPDDVIERI